MSSYLAESRYGKDKVRVFRVVREGKVHHIVEYNVQVLLEGDLETRRATLSVFFFFLAHVPEGEGQLHGGGQQRRRRDGFYEEHHILCVNLEQEKDD